MLEAEARALYLEELNDFLQRVADLSEKGILQWNCVNYDPISFMPDIEIGRPDRAYLVHAIKSTTEYNRRTWILYLQEEIHIPSGMGDIEVTIACAQPHRNYSARLSNRDIYGDCPPNKLMETFKNDSITRIANAVIAQVVGSETVNHGFAYALYDVNDYPDDVTNSPLTFLGKRLLDERGVADFHRTVLDTSYRKKLLQN